MRLSELAWMESAEMMLYALPRRQRYTFEPRPNSRDRRQITHSPNVSRASAANKIQKQVLLSRLRCHRS